jgi:hypothetical protein
LKEKVRVGHVPLCVGEETCLLGFGGGTSEERDYSKYLDVDGRIMLKRFLRK